MSRKCLYMFSSKAVSVSSEEDNEGAVSSGIELSRSFLTFKSKSIYTYDSIHFRRALEIKTWTIITGDHGQYYRTDS